jgi:hypothetical protein
VSEKTAIQRIKELDQERATLFEQARAAANRRHAAQQIASCFARRVWATSEPAVCYKNFQGAGARD